jgi:hypothetical protein
MKEKQVMSCILYSLASYVKLASHPAFVAAFQDSLRTNYDSAEAFAEALFELNAKAYRDRYSLDDGSDEIEQERTSDRPDSVFSEFLAAHRYATPKAYAALWGVFGRVEYQASDAHDFYSLTITFHLFWARNFCARRMVAAIESYAPPPPIHTPCAELRDELNLILRAADDSPDFQTADVVCRAANRAFALVDQLEGKEAKERLITSRAA